MQTEPAREPRGPLGSLGADLLGQARAEIVEFLSEAGERTEEELVCGYVAYRGVRMTDCPVKELVRFLVAAGTLAEKNGNL